jgi:putative colanic acid biosynthesis acetyltransferase WcaF
MAGGRRLAAGVRGEIVMADAIDTSVTTRAALDVAANRSSRKYGGGELAGRVAWSLASLLFRLSPRPCHAWRCFLLRRFGAKIGRHVHIYPTVRIQHPWLLEVGDYAAIGEEARIYNLGSIKIGPRATISQHAYLCAGSHDHASPDMRLLKLPIAVGADAWVCADAFVGPGVSVGEGAVVGARAAAFSDVPPWTIVGGNPAKYIKERQIHDADSHQTPQTT